MTDVRAVQPPRPLSACLGVGCGWQGLPVRLSRAVLGEEGWEEGARVVVSTAAGLGWRAAQDVPCSLRVPVGHWDRSFTLRDLLGTGRRWANLGLGKVDEELCTVTKEKKPHSLARTLR